jgi:hypothetical protein
VKTAGNNGEDNVTTYKGAKYKEHDKIRYQTGKVAFTVRQPLGVGTFGEVHVVYSEVQHRERAMKATRFDGMTAEQRNSLFMPLCEEALIGVDIGHHANMITPRYDRIGSEGIRSDLFLSYRIVSYRI